jgi:hypothetical protein
MATEIPSNALLATTLGLTMSGGFIGTSLTCSYLAIPALLLSFAPGTSAATQSEAMGRATRSWQYIYDLGKKAGPLAGVIGSAAYAYAAYMLPPEAITQKRLLFAAAVANTFVGPFTGAVMASTNDELIKRATDAKAGVNGAHEGKGTGKGRFSNYTTPDLLKRWARLNTLRGGFPLVATIATGLALSI